MDCKFLFVLILFTQSAKIHSRTFYCKERASFHQCTITGVETQDDSIVPYSSLYGLKYNVSLLVILNSTMDDIQPISSDSLVVFNLRCVGCGLSQITKNSFSQLVRLAFLDISFGSYQKLQENMFSEVSALVHLNVSHGTIADIDDTAFSKLEKLKILDLSFNNITKITSKMFAQLKDLYFLYLSYNHIVILEEGLLISNTYLKNLYLGHNNIRKINGGILNPQHNAEYVDLSYN